jgi:hypothetical protein
MNNEIDSVSNDKAKEALESIVKLESAGWRRAVPKRWFGAGIAILVGSMFAIYALADPYPYILFPILGLAIFITAAREKTGAYGRDFPGTKANRWAMVLFTTVLMIVFFGSIYIRRAYDLAWVPLLAGLLVALVIFLISESERRAYLSKAEDGQAE